MSLDHEFYNPNLRPEAVSPPSMEKHDGSVSACNAIESLVLALEAAGCDMEEGAMVEAIEAVVDAVGD